MTCHVVRPCSGCIWWSLRPWYFLLVSCLASLWDSCPLVLLILRSSLRLVSPRTEKMQVWSLIFTSIDSSHVFALKYHLLFIYLLYFLWQQRSCPLLRTNTCSCVPSSYAMPWQWRYVSLIESMAIGCFKIWLIYSSSFLHQGFAHFPWCSATSLGCYIDICYPHTCIWWGNFLDGHSIFWNLFDCWKLNKQYLLFLFLLLFTLFLHRLSLKPCVLGMDWV